MTAIEDHLSELMQSPSPTSTGRWDEVTADAARVRRRDRSVQRMAVTIFVAGLITGWLLIDRWSGTIDTAPAAAQEFERDVTRSRFSVGHLLPGLALLGALVVAFVVAAVRTRPTGIENRGWRRMFLFFSAAPVLYGPLLLAAQPANDITIVGLLGWVSKLVAIPVIPLLLWFLGERVAEEPRRWRTITAVWVILGVGVVLTARGLVDDIVRIGVDRLWPTNLGHNAGQGEILPYLDHQPGADWTESRILTLELAWVAGLGVLNGLLVLALRRKPQLVAIAIPLAVFVALGIYQTVAPLGFTFDFDPFWGDLVLGSVYSELVFAPFPLEPFGAAAISIASLSMVALLWLWGGPIPAEDPEWWKDTKREDSDETEDDD